MLVKYGEDIEELDLRSLVWDSKGDVMLGVGRGFVWMSVGLGFVDKEEVLLLLLLEFGSAVADKGGEFVLEMFALELLWVIFVLWVLLLLVLLLGFCKLEVWVSLSCKDGLL